MKPNHNNSAEPVRPELLASSPELADLHEQMQVMASSDGPDISHLLSLGEAALVSLTGGTQAADSVTSGSYVRPSLQQGRRRLSPKPATSGLSALFTRSRDLRYWAVAASLLLLLGLCIGYLDTPRADDHLAEAAATPHGAQPPAPAEQVLAKAVHADSEGLKKADQPGNPASVTAERLAKTKTPTPPRRTRVLNPVTSSRRTTSAESGLAQAEDMSKDAGAVPVEPADATLVDATDAGVPAAPAADDLEWDDETLDELAAILDLVSAPADTVLAQMPSAAAAASASPPHPASELLFAEYNSRAVYTWALGAETVAQLYGAGADYVD